MVKDDKIQQEYGAGLCGIASGITGFLSIDQLLEAHEAQAMAVQEQITNTPDVMRQGYEIVNHAFNWAGAENYLAGGALASFAMLMAITAVYHITKK